MEQIDIYATTTIFEKIFIKLVGKNKINSNLKKDNCSVILKIKYKFSQQSDLWIEILKMLGENENIISVTNDDIYTNIKIKNKAKIKQKDLFNLLKICKIEFNITN